jgi:hypothetical protein
MQLKCGTAYQLAANLTEVLIGLRQLTEQVDDTLMAVGSEAMGSSLTVYDYVKTAAKKTPGLKTIAEQLGERFKAIKSKPAKALRSLNPPINWGTLTPTPVPPFFKGG